MRVQVVHDEHPARVRVGSGLRLAFALAARAVLILARGIWCALRLARLRCKRHVWAELLRGLIAQRAALRHGGGHGVNLSLLERGSVNRWMPVLAELAVASLKQNGIHYRAVAGPGVDGGPSAAFGLAAPVETIFDWRNASVNVRP